jgi:hypothetical protein
VQVLIHNTPIKFHITGAGAFGGIFITCKFIMSGNKVLKWRDCILETSFRITDTYK